MSHASTTGMASKPEERHGHHQAHERAGRVFRAQRRSNCCDISAPFGWRELLEQTWFGEPDPIAAFTRIWSEVLISMDFEGGCTHRGGGMQSR